MSSLNNVSSSMFKRFYIRPLIVAVVLVALFAGVWHFLNEKQIEIQKIERVKMAELNSLRSQVSFLQSQVRLYMQYGEKYKDLVRKGIIKQQDRVFWADSLIQMQKTLVMPDFSFQFTPEQVLDSARFSNITLDKGIFYFSRLNLNMALQHDGDLLRLLNAINARISPFYLVDRCRFEMIESGEEVTEELDAAFDVESGNIQAECSLIVFHSHSKLAANF